MLENYTHLYEGEFSPSMCVLLYYKWNQGANEFGKKLMVQS